MRLAACVEPQEVLRPAPLSALCHPAPGVEWAGFWALDGERYYARLRTMGMVVGGDPVVAAEQWFVLVDTVPPTTEERAPDADALTVAGGAWHGAEAPEAAVTAERRSAFTARVVLRRSTIRPSIDGPAIRRTAAIMVGHRRGDTAR